MSDTKYSLYGARIEELLNVAHEKAIMPIRRTYVEGTSYDNEDFSTDEERTVLENIMRGVVSEMSFGAHTRSEIESMLNTAEFIFMKFFPSKESEEHINTYDTIYGPLLQAWTKYSEEV